MPPVLHHGHSRESGNPGNAGIDWIPAFAGMTEWNGKAGHYSLISQHSFRIGL